MSISGHHESARIFQFVPKTRSGQPVRREQAAVVVELMPARPVFCDFGSASYHDAAIQEERARKP